MDQKDELAEGWKEWYAEPDGSRILTFRPDVFDGTRFPPSCIPTIYVNNEPHRHRRPDHRPGRRQNDPTWYLAFFLEPDVVLTEKSFDSHAESIDSMHRLAAAFSRGDVEYRSAYQVPREDYLDALDSLCSREI